jgi:hypothetical protein
MHSLLCHQKKKLPSQRAFGLALVAVRPCSSSTVSFFTAWDPYNEGQVAAKLVGKSKSAPAAQKGLRFCLLTFDAPGLVSNNFQRMNLRKSRGGNRIGAKVCVSGLWM